MSDQEYDRAERCEAEPGKQGASATDLVREATEQQERADHACGVGREDQRDRQLGEAELLLVEDIERRGQRRAEHRHGKCVGDRDEGRTPFQPEPLSAHRPWSSRFLAARQLAGS
jgi:hypothetical protein